MIFISCLNQSDCFSTSRTLQEQITYQYYQMKQIYSAQNSINSSIFRSLVVNNIQILNLFDKLSGFLIDFTLFHTNSMDKIIFIIFISISIINLIIFLIFSYIALLLVFSNQHVIARCFSTLPSLILKQLSSKFRENSSHFIENSLSQ